MSQKTFDEGYNAGFDLKPIDLGSYLFNNMFECEDDKEHFIEGYNFGIYKVKLLKEVEKELTN